LVHISELAQHHVENPREVVAQGDQVQAKIIEVDPERRRLSLSLKRVEGEGPTPASELGLSDEVFGSDQQTGAEPSPEPVAAPEEPVLDVEAPPEPEPTPEPEPEPEPEAAAAPEESDEQQQ
jgi:small subunit ribosomal protein S1